jgi:uncharacterized protein (TIGR02679 family)
MTTSAAGPRLPDELRRYLADDSLSGLWGAVRARLERNGLTVAGQAAVPLDERAADRLSGLLGTPLRPGDVKVQLPVLDAALRRSAAAAGLVTVTGAVTGAPLVDRRAQRAARAESWVQVWQALDTQLAAAGLADAPWIPAFVEGVRRSGLFTRAGVEAALTAVEHAAATLGDLAPHGPLTEPTVEAAEARWELAELAGRCTGDAHGLDDGRLTGALVLRAAAVALGERVPASAAARRELWARLGVIPDLVSGTVLAWGLRPDGRGRWAAMMRDRSDLRLVTHLTLYELRGAAAGTALAAAGQRVYACENPQVLQAAARAECGGPLVCLSGTLASAGWLLLRGLLGGGRGRPLPRRLRLAGHGDRRTADGGRCDAVAADRRRLRRRGRRPRGGLPADAGRLPGRDVVGPRARGENASCGRRGARGVVAAGATRRSSALAGRCGRSCTRRRHG